MTLHHLYYKDCGTPVKDKSGLPIYRINAELANQEAEYLSAKHNKRIEVRPRFVQPRHRFN